MLGNVDEHIFSKVDGYNDARLHVCIERLDVTEHNAKWFGFQDYTAGTLAEFARHAVFVFNCGQFAFATNDVMKHHFENVCSEIAEVRRSGNKNYFYEQSFMNNYFNKRFLTAQTLHTSCKVQLPHWPALEGWPTCVLHLADSQDSALGKLKIMMEHYERFLNDHCSTPYAINITTGSKPVDVAFVAFYCGPPENDGRIHGSSRVLRPHLLRATLRNVRSFAKRVVVGVCCEHDRDLVTSHALDDCLPDELLQVSVQVPWDLPHVLCRAMQQRCNTLHPDIIMYFTEADQLSFVNERHVSFLKLHGGGAYLSGHRLEQLDAADTIDARPRITLANRTWVLSNEHLPVRAYVPTEAQPRQPCLPLAVYMPGDWVSAYSATFLCTAHTLLNHARFVVARPGKPPDGWSLEAPSWSMFHSCKCFKTAAVHDHFTLHLGDYEYVASRKHGTGENMLAVVLNNIDEVSKLLQGPV